MRNWKTVLFNICFALNCLLIFLSLFDERLQLPGWLQVGGRLHPLVLHFPIVILVVVIIWEIFSVPSTDNQRIGDTLLISLAFSAVITSMAGLFLSREEGYDPDTLFVHKWGGVFLSVLSLLWYNFRDPIRNRVSLKYSISVAGLILLFMTGHRGAVVTHGDNFLLAPITPDKKIPEVLIEDAMVYDHMVLPVLEAKCNSCHNERKAKGELVMESYASMIKGGKTGELWDTTKAGLGLMFDRIHLPQDQKKHMPPKGKPQLTEDEIAILYHWVKRGAPTDLKVTELPAEDTLHMIATNFFRPLEQQDYDFDPADEETVRKLRTDYRNVYPLALGSPALQVDFYTASQFEAEQLKELLPVKEQLVSLNLNRMPVKDEDLSIISKFTSLRKLNLANTTLEGKNLEELSKLKMLKTLILSGTAVRWEDLKKLGSLEELTSLYVWNAAITPEELREAPKYFDKVHIHTGYSGDTVVIKLNPPMIRNEELVFTDKISLDMKHYVNGVSIHYTTDGTEPDSISSSRYDGPVDLVENALVKAKAFKKGWISSEISEKTFYKSALRPDSMALVQVPMPNYTGDGSKTLIDLEKGDFNFRSGKWLGYREKPMEAIAFFDSAVTISSVSFSHLVDIPSYIFPPSEIEIWGGNSAGSLKLLKKFTPEQPTASKAAFMKGFHLETGPRNIKVIKILVRPVRRLPSWHQGKGEKAWIFMDEIFFN